MRRASALLLATLSLFAVVACQASAEVEPDEVTIDRSTRTGHMGWSADCEGDDCKVSLRVSRGGRTVGRDRTTTSDEEYDYGYDDGYMLVGYLLECSATGRLYGTVTVTGSNVPEHNGVYRSGFDVPRCKTKARPVNKATAASYAASGYEDEFVSRSICAPMSALRNGRASSWRCTVVYNNTYRECTTVLQLRYSETREFMAYTVRNVDEKQQSIRCVSF